jgi:hypothetical protein
MRLLGFILLLLAVPFVALALLPVLAAGVSAAFGLAFVVIWLLPIVIIAASNKTTGGEKLAWILAIVCLSWFAWIFYFLLAPIKAKPGYAYREYRYR